MKRFAMALIIACCASFSAYADPEKELEEYSGELYQLYRQYSSYHDVFRRYALTQGFRRPYEQLATVVHEIIHVDSAGNRAFFIDGAYRRPYITDAGWPNVFNKEILLSPTDGVTALVYLNGTPNNRLPNVLDEINAYTHILLFVAIHEPESLSKQMTNFRGQLSLAKHYADVFVMRGEILQPENASIANSIISRASNALSVIGDVNSASITF